MPRLPILPFTFLTSFRILSRFSLFHFSVYLCFPSALHSFSSPLHYFIRFFFFDLTVKLRTPAQLLHLIVRKLVGRSAETAELVAPYVPCRRWRYSLSYPYRTSPLRALRAAIELRDWEPEPSRVWIFGSQRRGTTWVRPASGCHHSVYLTYGDHTLWIFRKRFESVEFRRWSKYKRLKTKNGNVF